MTPVSALREDQRAAYIRGLRALADVLEAHPEVPVPYHGNQADITISAFLHSEDPRAELAAAARAFPCNWEKAVRDDGTYGSYFDLHGKLHGLSLRLTAYRDAVCERVVTGTRDIEVEEEIRPAETRKVVKQVETAEWVCHPLLAPAARPESPAAA